MIAGEEQNLQKRAERGRQDEIIEDLVSHCNNLAFYCAYSKRYFFSFNCERFNVIYVLVRLPYKALMGGPWWARLPNTLTVVAR